MALKPDRSNHPVDDISYFMYSTGERGGIAVQTTGYFEAVGVPGSGGAMDSSAQRVEYAAQPSGRTPIGMLMQDVVNIDLARQVLNPYKSEVQIGDKVTLVRKGFAVTNYFEAGAGPTGSIPVDLYLGPTGTLSTTNPNFSHTISGIVVKGTAVPKIGQAMSRKDADGYAKVYIELPS